MKINNNLMCLVFLMLVVIAGYANADNDNGITGVFGIAPVEENSAMAIWVPLEPGQAVSSLRWYNNDDSTAFPEILAISGDPNHPEVLAQAVVVAENVVGEVLDWSTVYFNQPVATVGQGLYLIFRLPVGEGFVNEGQNGGPGLGYMESDGIQRCWLTGDGENWHPLNPINQMAIEPVCTVNKSGNVLVLGQEDILEELENDLEVPVVIACGLSAAPNPFNPQTNLQFSLPISQSVKLSIYDIRGQLVRNLLDEHKAAGEHTVVWNGSSDNGSSLPSGIYLARLTTGSANFTTRLSLVK